MMASGLTIWWMSLCAAAAINTVLWVLAARQLDRRKAGMSAAVHAMRVRLLWLAAIYTAGCGFRSVFPMIDVPRICLHDTGLSRIIIGRSVATAAELGFALQLALLLRVESAAAGGRLAALVSRVIVPCIGVAELFSWTAVLRQNYLMNAVENSLWALAATLVISAVLSLWVQAVNPYRRFFGLALACAIGYVVYMGVVDVPMYVSRWHSDVTTNLPDVSLGTGFHQILRRCTVVREWSVWRLDVPWLSLYFTAAVWMSIALVHAPMPGGVSRQEHGDQPSAGAPPA
jgi:hypothetical protein